VSDEITPQYVRDKFAAFGLVPVAHPVFGDSGNFSGVVFPAEENSMLYHRAFLEGATNPASTFNDFEKSVAGLSAELGIADASQRKLFHDVAEAYVNAIKDLHYAVPGGKRLSDAARYAIKDLWGRVVAAESPIQPKRVVLSQKMAIETICERLGIGSNDSKGRALVSGAVESHTHLYGFMTHESRAGLIHGSKVDELVEKCSRALEAERKKGKD